MRATIQDINAEQGAVLSLVLRNPVSSDLTGKTLVLTVKKTALLGTTKLVATTANGQLTVVSAKVVQVSVPSDVMAAISVDRETEEWVYNLESNSTAEDVVREWEGKFTISKDISSTESVPDVDANAYLLVSQPQALTEGQKAQAIANLGFVEGTGDVVGPSASVDARLAEFSGTTGKLIRDSGTSLVSLISYVVARVNHTGTQLASTISDFASAALLAVTWANLTGKPSSFPPAGHNTSHASVGSDPITPADIGAQAALVSGTNIKTVNSTSLLGPGDIAISANPAGSGTEPQYRNGSSFGAMSGVSWDDTNRAETRTGATVTASHPVQSFTQIWNNGAVPFTGWKLNITDTASSSASTLVDLQINGTTKFCVLKSGNVNAPFFGPGGASAGGLVFTSGYTTLRSYDGTNKLSTGTGSGLCIAIGGLSFGPDYYTAGASIVYDALNVLNMRSSTSANTLRISGTHTDSSNYVRGSMAATSTTVTLAAETSGSGADNVPVNIN